MKNIKLAIGVLILGVGFSSCKSNETKKEPISGLKVTVQEVTPIHKTGQFEFPGKVKADDKLTLSTKLIGQVEQVYVNEGDQVAQGQLLVKIRSNDISSKLASAQASLNEATSSLNNIQKNFERISRLYEKGSATQKELDDITTVKDGGTARVESINQSIAELNELLTYTDLRSPINGFISQKFINKGAMATPGSPLIVIESFDKLKVEINVPEFEIGLFKKGDPVEIEISAVNASSLKGYVDRIVLSSGNSGSQYQVLIAFTEKNKTLNPGMFARVNLLKNSESKTIVPQMAIVQRGQLSGLFTVSQQGEAMLRWVRLGKEYPEGIEVLSGLEKGEQFIVSSESKLTDGIKVEITKSI